MNDLNTRLDALRGPAEPKKHNARTIAALSSNPGCARRSVLDAAGVDKQALAGHVGYPAAFGMSPFAIARGVAFEALVKANGCAELLRLLRELVDLPLPEVAYDDLNSVGGHESLEARHRRSRQLLATAARSAEDAGTLFDHPLLRMDIGGRNVYLEPDLVAFRLRDRFHVVEIKSFPVIDGRADARKVAAAATQSAVYVLAMRALFDELGVSPELVSHEVFLVCPADFSNRPIAALIDVRKQLTVVRRQLSRLADIRTLVADLPAGLTLDLGCDDAGQPTRPAEELREALELIDARYAPECLDICEMTNFCRAGARGHTAALGRTVQEELGGVDTVGAALGLATGERAPGEHEVEAAQVLRLAERLRDEILGGAA
ncbi:hypothetical protein SAMN05421837_12142 [Amycolatopsis pretoriensis]|uniref:Secreted protein n=1 Tax=Amycolatopsis pretoriensis TaxID=218821 RepID=A0A1H5RLN0_9PSEU|nr:hypothetical protein [Amycolatopsis pretoriensis]SEF38411.1 hypothetical protein SAMN05421837_12142 [Amycolatopsis pretoriensis]